MAIAFDVGVNSGIGGASGTSFSWSHTCTGTNRFLLVAVSGRTDTDVITGVTYNGVSMTQISHHKTSSGRWVHLFFLRNPASGANTVTMSASSSIDAAFGCSASYTGAAQTGAIDATSNANTASGTTHNHSLTPVASSCWVAFQVRNDNNAVPAAGTATTLRAIDGRLAIMDNNAAINPPASTQLQATNDIAAGWDSIMCSIDPASGTNFTKTVTETITDTDSIAKATARILTEVITDTDTILKALARSIIETVTDTDTLIRGFFLSLKETVTSTAQVFGKALWHFVTKNVASWTHQTKNTASWTNQNKNAATWTFVDKDDPLA